MPAHPSEAARPPVGAIGVALGADPTQRRLHARMLGAETLSQTRSLVEHGQQLPLQAAALRRRHFTPRRLDALERADQVLKLGQMVVDQGRGARPRAPRAQRSVPG
jgi:hypothetical protein